MADVITIGAARPVLSREDDGRPLPRLRPPRVQDPIQEWPEPTPLEGSPTPTFPLDALPRWQREWCEAVSEQTQTPPDLAAVLALTAQAAAVSSALDAEARPGWVEPTNLYTLTVLPPASRKSAVCAKAIYPLEDYERERSRDMQAEIAASEAQHRVLEARAKGAEAAAAKEKNRFERENAEAEAEALAKELAKHEPLKSPRILADDVTPERLAGLLRDHGGRVAIMSAEGGIFETIAGRYSSGTPNLDVYLKGHAGESLRVDRVGRAAEYVPSARVTLGLVVQPDILRSLLAKPRFRGTGLLARFWYCLPSDTIGSRHVGSAPVPQRVRETYGTELRRRLDWAEAVGSGERRVMRLDDGAAGLRDQFDSWLEPQLGRGRELAGIQDWAGKLLGLTLRIAALLEVGRDVGAEVISEATMGAAIGIGLYAIGHAQSAFGEMRVGACTEDARVVLDHLKAMRCREFSKKVLFDGMRSRFETAADLDPALDALVEAGWIRPLKPEAGPKGGRPSRRFGLFPGVTR